MITQRGSELKVPEQTEDSIAVQASALANISPVKGILQCLHEVARSSLPPQSTVKDI